MASFSSIFRPDRPLIAAFARPLSRVSPDRAYVFFALFFGTAFLFLTPPAGVADEVAHFQRAIEVADGAWLGAEGSPRGVQAFLDHAFDTVRSERAFSAEDHRALARYPFRDDEIEPYADVHDVVMRIHNPLAYVVYAPSIWIGRALDLPVLTVFRLCRLTTMMIGLGLVIAAIKTAPSRKWVFATIALCPACLFFLPAVNLDAILLGASFLFVSTVYRALVSGEVINAKTVALLAFLSFCLGATKTPYAVLSLSALMLAAANFTSLIRRAVAMLVIIAPAFVAAVVWAFVVKHLIVGDLAYSTPAGGFVSPSAQFAAILANPIGYFIVNIRTILDVGAIARASFFSVGLLGWNSYAIPAWATFCVFASIGVGVSSEPTPTRLRAIRVRAIAISVFALVVSAALFIIYLQWNEVGAGRIVGFQARYLLPLAPLLIFVADLRAFGIPSIAVRNAAFLAAPTLAGGAAIAATAAQYG